MREISHSDGESNFIKYNTRLASAGPGRWRCNRQRSLGDSISTTAGTEVQYQAAIPLADFQRQILYH